MRLYSNMNMLQCSIYHKDVLGVCESLTCFHFLATLTLSTFEATSRENWGVPNTTLQVWPLLTPWPFLYCNCLMFYTVLSTSRYCTRGIDSGYGCIEDIGIDTKYWFLHLRIRTKEHKCVMSCNDGILEIHVPANFGCTTCKVWRTQSGYN